MIKNSARLLGIVFTILLALYLLECTMSVLSVHRPAESSRSWELCWYGNKNIRGGGRGERQGDEERWTKKSREMGKAEVSWVIWVSNRNVSLYYPWPPPPCLTLALILSLTYYLTLALSSSVFLQSLPLLPWTLFASYSYSCPLHTRQCVCVCGGRFHSEILKCLLSALFLSSYSPAAAVIRIRVVNCDSSSKQSSNPILQQYLCTHVNWILALNRFKFHFYVKYDTHQG